MVFLCASGRHLGASWVLLALLDIVSVFLGVNCGLSWGYVGFFWHFGGYLSVCRVVFVLLGVTSAFLGVMLTFQGILGSCTSVS